MENSLNCSADRCVNNTGGFCTASIITVEGLNAVRKEDTCCGEFAINNFINSVKELGNTNYIGIAKQSLNFQKYPIKPEIHCTAKNCVYNKSAICTAHAVEIYGPNVEESKGTECNSFEIVGNHVISTDYF